jgi:CubicO group peptidase (beta-lactamase class C family)
MRDPAASVVARYRQQIPAIMKAQGVPGLAVALVAGDRPLWVEGFGTRDDHGAPVTVDTVFSVQSMSKLFTATAVMREVEAGRLDLDTPITSYVPEFSVHSAFEQHPERKITLRMLLSHTAGFDHEAPVGNNNDLGRGDFDQHVRSISHTWLRFPVGTGEAYSNLGIDLAGYILERVEGKPFAQVMHDTLIEPLGMDHSTFDQAMIRSIRDRAVGHVSPYPRPPLDVPMAAAGGLYASAADLARFLRFQFSDGSIDGRVVLAASRMEEMRTVPAPNSGAPAGYALGVVRHVWNRWDQRPTLFDHGGGGFGFLSDLWWLPDLQIGIAILTNSQDHQLQGDLALSILGDLVSEPGVYRDRLLALPSRPPVDDPNTSFRPPPEMASLVANAAMIPTGDEASRWRSYAGSYRVRAWNVVSLGGAPDRFFVSGGVAYYETRDRDFGPTVRHRLVEVQPGVFLADNGQTLDMRSRDPTRANLRIVRVTGGPAAWQWVTLGASAFIAAAWLVAAAARSVKRRRMRAASTPKRGTHTAPARIAATVATITATLVLAVVALLAVSPGLVDSGFVGWLELPMAARLAMHLPWALAILAGPTVALTIWGSAIWGSARWGSAGWWSSVVRPQYWALSLATIALVAQLAAWRLIGWGLT